LWSNTTQSQGKLQESTGDNTYCINTEAQKKDKQTKNEVMMMVIIIIIIINNSNNNNNNNNNNIQGAGIA
jgi:hypothetical protein